LQLLSVGVLGGDDSVELEFDSPSKRTLGARGFLLQKPPGAEGQ
jgi:hypothetical protein